MKLKTIFLALLIIQLIVYALWLLGYIGASSMSETARQTYAIMGNVKLLLVIAWYIAWRVTP